MQLNKLNCRIQRTPVFLFHADISKCFDCIDHDALLRKIGVQPIFYKQIRGWLKSGILDNFELREVERGTPQGGVISPLLANITLHGMEEVVNQYILGAPLRNKRGIAIGSREKVRSISLIRYGDDFVILHESKFVVEICGDLIKDHLALMGLILKPEKRRVAHTLSPELSEPSIAGFDFLGFHIQQ